MSNNNTQPVRGTHDILPDEQLLKQHMDSSFSQTAELFGFGKIDTPAIEYSSIFTKSLGGNSEIINKEMYLLRHKEGDLEIALRPENTAGIVRAFISNGMFTKSMPVRLYYIGPMFRHERPQKGRLRQFWQQGIESIGEAAPSEDAIVIAMAITYLNKLNIPKSSYQLEINSIGCKACRVAYEKLLLKYLKKLKFDPCEDCKLRITNKRPLRVFDCKVTKCQKQLTEAPAILDTLCQPCQSHFKEVLEFLEISEVAFTVNPRLARGLDYYNRTVFEFIAQKTDIKGQAIIAGGRYDDLISQMSNKNFPAVGFALGYERLAAMYNQLKLPPIDNKSPLVFMVQLGTKAKLKTLSLMAKLAACDIPVQAALAKDTLRSQLKAADKAKAKYALILGQREILDDTVMLKDLTTGSQETIPNKKLIGKLLGE